MYLVLSVPPNVSSPLAAPEDVVGSNEMPIESSVMVPCAKRLSVTVGTEGVPETVVDVKSTGPIPRMPSTPWKPSEREATPIDWF